MGTHTPCGISIRARISGKDSNCLVPANKVRGNLSVGVIWSRPRWWLAVVRQQGACFAGVKSLNYCRQGYKIRDC